jgi:hypothetical protein
VAPATGENDTVSPQMDEVCELDNGSRLPTGSVFVQCWRPRLAESDLSHLGAVGNCPTNTTGAREIACVPGPV